MPSSSSNSSERLAEMSQLSALLEGTAPPRPILPHPMSQLSATRPIQPRHCRSSFAAQGCASHKLLAADVEIEEVAEQLPRHSADADSGGKPQPNTKPYIHRRYYL